MELMPEKVPGSGGADNTCKVALAINIAFAACVKCELIKFHNTFQRVVYVSVFFLVRLFLRSAASRTKKPKVISVRNVFIVAVIFTGL